MSTHPATTILTTGPAAPPVRIHDPRSVFDDVTVGALPAPGTPTTHLQSLTQALHQHTASAVGARVSAEEIVMVSASVPPQHSEQWLRETTALLRSCPGLSAAPAAVVVGPGQPTTTPTPTTPAPAPVHRPLPAETTCARRPLADQEWWNITGPDTSEHQLGMMLAVSLLSGGRGALIQRELDEHDLDATALIGRHRAAGRPVVTWDVLCPRGTGGQVLHTALSALSTLRHAPHLPGLTQAVTTLRSHLESTWDTPRLLSETLVRYALMGWGTTAILHPEDAFDHLDAETLTRSALPVLEGPLAAALGATV